MTISLSEILIEKHLKYKRLHYMDYINRLGAKPTTVSYKIILPSFFKSLFDDSDNIDIISVSGKKKSFWHCLLYCVYAEYNKLSWYKRKVFLQEFIDELENTYKGEDIKFDYLIPSDRLLYYFCDKFNINFVLCDNTRLYCYLKNNNNPSIVLYQDDNPIFHIVVINDEILTLNKHIYKFSPLPLPLPLPRALPLPHALAFTSKMKLAELQTLAIGKGIDILKKGKTKMINKTKQELVNEISKNR